jgi:minor histocompatibility antigen H13
MVWSFSSFSLGALLIAVFITFFSYLQESGEKPETMSHKDAAMFPIIASAALFGLYIFFQVRVIITLNQ